jgi:hypothetical protein
LSNNLFDVSGGTMSNEPVLTPAQKVRYGEIADALEAQGYHAGDGCLYEIVAYPDAVVLEQRLPNGSYHAYDLS